MNFFCCTSFSLIAQEYINSENYKFKGTYNLNKLENIISLFNGLFEKYAPSLVIIEKPAPVRHSKAVTSLNQVFGAIVATAIVRDIHVNEVHNKTVKKTFNYKTKGEAIDRARFIINSPKADITEHEADAILVVETYKEIIKWL